MIYLQSASWALFALAGCLCALNFYLSFLRYPIHLWHGHSKESYRFISGIPLLGSLIVYLLLRYANLPPVMEMAAIGLIVIDTGGIHWAIGNIVYQSFRYVLVSGVIKHFFSYPLATELVRPWKLITLTIGTGLLIWGSFYYKAPDWDIPISLIMAFFAYLTASWSMHVMVERSWKRFPLMILLTWWSVDGCYSLYWFIKNPLALEYMRAANAPASLCLYWMCGLVWYWNGTLKSLFDRMKLGPRLHSMIKTILKTIAALAVIFVIYLLYYWRDMERLRAFCDQIKPGAYVSELHGIAEKYGFSPYWIRQGAIVNDSSIATYYVPAPASVGANVCAIHCNKKVVISAEIEID